MNSLFCAATFSIVLATLPAYADDFPRAVEDDRQTPVTLDAQPERIVALATFGADMIAALGRKPVGITTYEGVRPVYLGDAVAVSTDLGELPAPNLELLDSLAPDLTLGSLRYNGPFEKEISRSGAFLAWAPAGVEKSNEIVAEMGAALGESKAALAMNEDFAALRADYAAQTGGDGPSFLFVWNFFDTFYAYQDNLLSAELLSEIGAENLVGFNADVETAEQAVVPLDPEQLLALDPEVLLVFTSAPGPIKNNPVFGRLQSVKNKKAYAVGYQWSESSGPIARELVLREGAALLYPDLFQRPETVDGAQAVPLTFTK